MYILGKQSQQLATGLYEADLVQLIKKVTSLSTVIVIIIVDSQNHDNNNRGLDLRDKLMGY